MILIPKNYHSNLDLYQTQKAIKLIKDFFQVELSLTLNLKRVTAPLFVEPNTGLNDNLNEVERAVSFTSKDHHTLEIVQSLAKWKRYALAKYNFQIHKGLYTDMNAIRQDETLDNLHSIYVDQYDWEKIILKEDRNDSYLEKTVKEIYSCLLKLEQFLALNYDYLQPTLKDEIFFITSEELLKLYPKNSPKEREYKISKDKGSVFIKQIGKKLSDHTVHDLRAADYDDWNLNGDLILYYPLLDIPFELSSMGIRVDNVSLHQQLLEANLLYKEKLPFQKAILENKLPLTIGGGIGQSRLCMYFLRKAHIGEVQVSYWSKEDREQCQKGNIYLL